MYLSLSFLIFFQITGRRLFLFFHAKRIITVSPKDVKLAFVSLPMTEAVIKIPKENQLPKCHLYRESSVISLTQNWP